MKFTSLITDAPEGTFEHCFLNDLQPRLLRQNAAAAMNNFRSSVGQFTHFRGRHTPLSEMNEQLILDFESWLVGLQITSKTAAATGMRIRQLIRMIDSELCRPKLKPYRRAPLVRTHGIGKRMTLSQYAADRYIVTHSLAARSEYMILRTCEKLEDFLASKRIVSDIKTIDEFLLSQWAKSLELFYAPRSIKHLVTNAICILNDAADAGLRSYIRSRRVRRVKCSPPQPEAWTVETIRALVLASRKLRGFLVNRVPRALYFETLLRCAWQLGLRRSDLFALRMKDIDFSTGRVLVIQRKTKTQTAGMLGEAELGLLQQIGKEQPLRWPGHEKTFYDLSHKVKRIAGVETPGHLQRIRKSAATNVAMRDRAQATKLLGHSGPGCDAFYVDERMLGTVAVQPDSLQLPEIGGAT